MREIAMRALDLLPRDVRNYERPASYVVSLSTTIARRIMAGRRAGSSPRAGPE